MKIVFMGTPAYATTILQELVQRFEVVGLFTQPDKPVGRKQIVTPPHIKKYVLENELALPIFQPTSLKDAVIIQTLRDLKPDFIVVAAYAMLLPKEILDMAPCINLHASLLPKYRGASPIQQALLNGDSITGVTAMLMNEGLDEGDILGYSVCKIAPDETAIELFDKLSFMAAKLTPKVIENFSNVSPLKQFDCDASLCKKIKKSNGLVTFDDARKIYNKYRAFILWPGIFLQSGLKLKKIVLHAVEGSYQPGEILKIGKESIIVGCQKGSIEILEVQPPSKKAMSSVAYIRGKRLGVGDTLL